MKSEANTDAVKYRGEYKESQYKRSPAPEKREIKNVVDCWAYKLPQTTLYKFGSTNF